MDAKYAHIELPATIKKPPLNAFPPSFLIVLGFSSLPGLSVWSLCLLISPPWATAILKSCWTPVRTAHNKLQFLDPSANSAAT